MWCFFLGRGLLYKLSRKKGKITKFCPLPFFFFGLIVFFLTIIIVFGNTCNIAYMLHYNINLQAEFWKLFVREMVKDSLKCRFMLQFINQKRVCMHCRRHRCMLQICTTNRSWAPHCFQFLASSPLCPCLSLSKESCQQDPLHFHPSNVRIKKMQFTKI